MKIGPAVLASVFVLVAASASAANWYQNVAPLMGAVEQSANGVIWLSRQSGTISIPGASSSCVANAIQLIPPSGKEKEWLAMVLAATLADKPLSIYGECDQANYRLNASRLVVQY